MKSIAIVGSCVALAAGLEATARAQVCTQTSPGVAEIQTTTPKTTIKLVGSVVKANGLPCGFAVSSIVVVGQPTRDSIALDYLPPFIPVTTQLAGGGDAVQVYETNGADTVICGAGSVDRDGDGIADLVFDAPPSTLAIYTRGGDDVVDCSAATMKVSIYGGDGGDDLTGSDFNDAIDAGAGDDVIHGGAGRDTITAGLGDDQAWGGAGNDAFKAQAVFDGTDQFFGETGLDSVAYSGRITAVIAGGAGAEDAISDDLETIKGGKAGDTLDFSATAQPHNLFGGPGNDVIRAGAGASKLYGEGGGDELYPGAAKDAVIDAGDGNDTIGATADGFRETVKCGAGADKFTTNGEDVFKDCEGVASSGAAQEISVGFAHTCAIVAGGAAKCWGYNYYGQLGTEDTGNRGDQPGQMGAGLAAIDLGTGRTAVAISAGYFHTCAILDDGTVKCWGSNDNGQLGQGDQTYRGDAPGSMGDALPAIDLGTGRSAVAIAAGGIDSCALLDDGTVKCWGANFDGQLGLGDTSARGDAPGEMGDALPAVDLGTGRTAVAIGADYLHTCAVLDDATLKCWGDGSWGAVGLGDWTPRGDQPGEMGDLLPVVDLGTGRTVVSLGVAEVHTCAVLDDGTVKCWGYGEALGLGDTTTRGSQPGQMGDALPTVDLGTGRTAVSVSGGEVTTCAALDDGSVKCWGWNSQAQLGVGDTNNRGQVPGQMGDALPPVALGTGRSVTAIEIGLHTGCARLDDDTMKCWGSNGSGELGQGDNDNRGDSAGEMGDALLPIDLGGLLGFAPPQAHDDGDDDAGDDGDVGTEDSATDDDVIDDAGTTDDAAPAGCSAAGGGSSLATGLLLGLALVVGRRRRR